MKTAFTPGPWEAEEAPTLKYCSSVIFRYQSGEKGTVALVGRVGATVGDSDLDRQNATARLIAAAPELYALVEESLFHLRLDERAEIYHHKALDVLAKARGEQ